MLTAWVRFSAECLWLQEFGEEKFLVHSGILASADWLYDRMYCVALVIPLPESSITNSLIIPEP